MVVNNYGSESNSNISNSFANRISEVERNKKEEAEEKLSSGKRINDASDDAAGLAITDEMLAVMKGWNAAAQNTTSAISFTQVADGALSEIQSMLQRVNELAVQSSNGIYQDTERSYMDAEMSALVEEIDRIASTTEFNGIPVLQTSQESQPVVESINDLMDNTPSSIATYSEEDTVVLLERATTRDNIVEMVPRGEGLTVSGEEGSFTYEDDVLTITSSGDFTVVGTGSETTDQVVVEDNVGDVNITLSNMGVEASDNTEIESIVERGVNNNVSVVMMNEGMTDENEISLVRSGFTVSKSSEVVTSQSDDNKEATTDFQVGNEPDDYITFSVQNMDSEALGLSDVSLATSESSLDVIDTVQSAIEMVSSYQSEIGATQNRLESTYSNLMSMVENTQNTISRISDADMAEEIVNATNSDLNVQVAQEMMKEERTQNENVIKVIEEGLVNF